jgi:benzodiazapine receptor
MRRHDWYKLIISLALPLLAGGIGSLFTAPAISGWYSQLQKPWFNPPSWVFGPAWTVLYILMGVALFLVWRSSSLRLLRQRALLAFGVQLVLNAAWSVIFFGLQRPDFAFMEIAMLWAAIVWTIVVFNRVRPVAAWLLAPYLAWVTFASCLNYAIALAN